MRVLLVTFYCVMPALAAAQTQPSALSRNDLTLTVAWAGSEHHIRDDRRWDGALLLGAAAGRYWTDHLKTEIEASWNGLGEEEIYETIQSSGGFTSAVSDYRARDIRVGVTQLFQFGRNEWVHPYIGVGVDVVRRDATFDRRAQTRTVYLQSRSIPVNIAAASERTTTVFAHGVLTTGLKMYVSEKAFFDTELKFGVRRDIDHVVWKLGMGFDF